MNDITIKEVLEKRIFRTSAGVGEVNSYDQGRQANALSENPYWKDYPEDNVSEEQKINARRFVDGYADKHKNNVPPNHI